MHPQRSLQGNKSYVSLRKKLRNELTPAENLFWLKVQRNQIRGLKFRRQHGIGPFIVDFYCAAKKIVVEIDGDVHCDDDQILKDQVREEYLYDLGLTIIRYKNGDVLKNIENVMNDLIQKIE